MVKHTPGPWVVLSQREPSMIEIQEQNDAGYTVASAWGGGAVEAQLDANARLIAAAPELLGALRVMTDTYIRLVESGDCGSWDPNTEEPVKYARALLAKIEGGE